MPSILNCSAKIAIPYSGYHYYEPLSLTVHYIGMENGYRHRGVSTPKKFTTIYPIDENFLTGPVGCHSVYTYSTFLLTSEANQYSKYHLEKYCSYELVFSSLRECHHHHLMLYQTYLIFVHLC